jgi:hypothetical protein
MTRQEKQALAYELLDRASQIIEFWYEIIEQTPELKNIPRAEAAQAISSWLKGLPGDRWPLNLPQPGAK